MQESKQLESRKAEEQRLGVETEPGVELVLNQRLSWRQRLAPCRLPDVDVILTLDVPP